MLDSARQHAVDVLLDRRVLHPDEQTGEAFARALAAPVEPDEALRALMRNRSPWEQPGSGPPFGLLWEAMIRTLRVSAEAGVRALIVHTIDDEAVSFCAPYGFQEFPRETRTMFLAVETIRKAIGG